MAQSMSEDEARIAHTVTEYLNVLGTRLERCAHRDGPGE